MAGKASKKTGTVAPKATTKLVVTVTDVDAAVPLPRAKVEVMGQAGGQVTQASKKADANGVWKSKPVAPDTYTIVVTLDHFGPPVTQPPAPASPVYPVVGPVTVTQVVAAPAAGAKPPATTPVQVGMMRAESTIKLPVVDETYSNILLIGASVVVENGAAQKTKPNHTIEVALPGGEHKVRVTKLGYSQSAATPNANVVAGKASGLKSSANVMKTPTTPDPGVVDYVVNLVLPLPRKPLEIPLPMVSQWKRVSNSSGIMIGGTAFSTWFNQTFMQDSTYNHPPTSILNISRFNDVFDNLSAFRSDALTLEEFVALFMVMMIEVGGTFKPVGEGGSLQYFFNPVGQKQSYNQAGNRRAGDLLSGTLLAAFPQAILTPPAPGHPNDAALIATWNGIAYPATLGKVTQANLQECDFYKYRGHSYIQVTWHDTYLGGTEFIRLLSTRFSVTGTPTQILDQISTADMESAIQNDQAIAFALMVAWFDQGGRWNRFLEVNDLQFTQFAKTVGGIGYGDYANWCSDLRTAMIAAGPNLGP